MNNCRLICICVFCPVLFVDSHLRDARGDVCLLAEQDGGDGALGVVLLAHRRDEVFPFAAQRIARRGRDGLESGCLVIAIAAVDGVVAVLDRIPAECAALDELHILRRRRFDLGVLAVEGDERLLGVLLADHRLYVTLVVLQAYRRVEHSARHLLFLGCQGKLLGQHRVGAELGRRRVGVEAVDTVAYEQIAAVGVRAPPVEARIEVGARCASGVVDLRDHHVEPSARHPFGHVGILPVVVVLHIALRRDGEHHLPSRLSDDLLQALHHQVDILPAPVGDVGKAAAVFLVLGIVVHALSAREARVEVVVHVDAVDVVLGDEVLDNGVQICAGLRQGGIEHADLIVVLDEHLRNAAVQSRERLSVVRARGDAIGINPRVEAHAALVGLVDEKLEHVVARILVHLARDKPAPGLVGRVVERIGHAAYLKEDRVDVQSLEGVEVFCIEPLLSRLRVESVGPVDAVDGSHPDGPHLLGGQQRRLADSVPEVHTRGDARLFHLLAAVTAAGQSNERDRESRYTE